MARNETELTHAVLTRKIGWFRDSFSTPPLTILHLSVTMPAISIAPQKLSSRSPVCNVENSVSEEYKGVVQVGQVRDTLREMQVANCEAGAGDVNGQPSL